MEQSSSFVQHQSFQLHLLRKEFQLDKMHQKTAKRVQEQKEEERTVAKSRPTVVNLSSTIQASSSSAKNLITSSDPEKLIAAGKPASRTRRNSRPYEAPSSQVKLKEVYLGGLMDDSAVKLVATEENQVFWEFLNLNPGAFMRMK